MDLCTKPIQPNLLNLFHKSASEWDKVSEDFLGRFSEVNSALFRKQPEELNSVKHYFKQVISYNVSSGKQIRGTLVPISFMSFVDLDVEDYQKKVSLAHFIGWCIELLHAGFLVLDDLMDHSSMRRGKPCWYLACQEAGLDRISINDGLFLILAAKQLLNAVFYDNLSMKDKSYMHLEISKLFDEMNYRTCSGQCLDMLGCQKFDLLNDDHYRTVVRWKTGFYSFYLPIACGMILAGLQKKEIFTAMEVLVLKIGHYFQIQDDYLDCYGDSTETGKVGTDIREGKCSWLIVEALKYVTDEQRELLKIHYGKPEKNSELIVKSIYDALDMRSRFKNYEMYTSQEIVQTIDDFCSRFRSPNNQHVQQLFHGLMDHLFKRLK